MENTVIEVLTEEHGAKVVEYFKSIGVDTGTFVGTCCKQSKNNSRFYGVINDQFANFTELMVQEYNCKVIELPTIEDTPTGVKIEVNYKVPTNTATRAQLKQIYKACTINLKYIIAKHADSIPSLDDSKEFTDLQIIEMYDNANDAAKVLLNSIFGERVTDKNAFVKKFTYDEPRKILADFSEYFFGNKYAVDLLTVQTPQSMEDLDGRAFYVSKSIKVTTGETENGGTWISFTHK